MALANEFDRSGVPSATQVQRGDRRGDVRACSGRGGVAGGSGGFYRILCRRHTLRPRGKASFWSSDCIRRSGIRAVVLIPRTGNSTSRPCSRVSPRSPSSDRTLVSCSSSSNTLRTCLRSQELCRAQALRTSGWRLLSAYLVSLRDGSPRSHQRASIHRSRPRTQSCA